MFFVVCSHWYCSTCFKFNGGLKYENKNNRKNNKIIGSIKNVNEYVENSLQ